MEIFSAVEFLNFLLGQKFIVVKYLVFYYFALTGVKVSEVFAWSPVKLPAKLSLAPALMPELAELGSVAILFEFIITELELISLTSPPSSPASKYTDLSF